MNSIVLTRRSSQVLISILLFLLVFVSYDTYVDHKSDAGKLHILLEMILLISVFFFLVYTLKKYIDKSAVHEKQLMSLSLEHNDLKNKLLNYKKDIHDYIKMTFKNWKLTKSEEDIAMLLFKGCTGKEIAEMRKTHYQTVRSQISSIYKKANVKNHNQFMAILMEDLL